MGLSRQEIIDHARRYIGDSEMTDFVHEGEVFCFVERQLGDKQAGKEEEWRFGGYGVCLGYTLDEESRPAGKWLWFSYASLNTFPPARQSLKLQPPHIVRGIFQNAGRTTETRILKLSAEGMEPGNAPAVKRDPEPFADDNRKILKFPHKQ